MTCGQKFCLIKIAEVCTWFPWWAHIFPPTEP